MKELTTVNLVDENGKAKDFVLLDDFFEGETEYLALMPEEENEDTGSVVFMQVVEEANDTSYEGVDDQDLCEALYEIFKARNIDEFDFEEI